MVYHVLPYQTRTCPVVVLESVDGVWFGLVRDRLGWAGMSFVSHPFTKRNDSSVGLL